MKWIRGLLILVLLTISCSSEMNKMNIAKKTTYRKNLDVKDADAHRESETSYDRNGHVVKEVLFDPSGNVIRSVEYSYNGNRCVREIHRDGNGQQLLVKDLVYQNEKLSRIEVKGAQSVTIDYTYQDNGEYDEVTIIGGQHKYQKHWDSYGKLLWEVNLMDGNRTDYAYDDRGNLTEIKEEHGEGHTSLRYQNEYDSEGNCVKIFMNGTLTSEFVYNEGWVVKEIRYTPEGNPEVEMIYQYEFKLKDTESAKANGRDL